MELVFEAASGKVPHRYELHRPGRDEVLMNKLMQTNLQEREV